ncbi:MAG TPA: SDR family NAD(P)-dependent oxidoreductase [Candidatus Cybelea sp.]|nr:SDR family NAD(P)-dependent oxidoreductase [Candidatus Cybelea sp.]
MSYRAALITGASGGIGAAFARALPAETHLVLTGRNTARLEQLAAQLQSPGRNIAVVPADLTAPDGRNAVIEAARTHAIDLLVCNAGGTKAGPFLKTAPSDEHATIGLNVVALAELLHAIAPPLIERARRDNRRAGIIVVSSAAALSASAGVASYGASKAFQLHLTRTLAAELQDEPVDIVVLCPTYTVSGFFARAGLAMPSEALSPEAVAREGLAALGRDTLRFYGTRRAPQALRQLLALNPALDGRNWPKYIARWYRRRVRRRTYLKALLPLAATQLHMAFQELFDALSITESAGNVLQIVSSL